MNSNYPYWTWPKRIPPPTINNSLYFLYWLLLREFSAVMQQNKTLFSFISFVVAVDYYVESLCDTVFHRCSEVATSIFQLYYHSLVTSVQALKWNHSVTDHHWHPSKFSVITELTLSKAALFSCQRDPVQLFFRVTWACSDTGTWKLFWVTPRCCKSMRAKTLMKKLFPIPHFLPFTYHGTSKVDGNVESKGLLSFYCSISELSVLLLLDISFFPFFPCNFPSSKISNFFQILK